MLSDLITYTNVFHFILLPVVILLLLKMLYNSIKTKKRLLHGYGEIFSIIKDSNIIDLDQDIVVTQYNSYKVRVVVESVIDLINSRYKPIIDIDKEYREVQKQISDIRKNNEIKVQEVMLKINELRYSYAEKKAVFDKLRSQLAVYDEKLSFAELGVYEPHFNFDDSETYKDTIVQTRAAQKVMVSEKTAVICSTTWTVDGSKAKGQSLINYLIRLTLRAFNNECEAAISNTRWNNVNAMEKRIIKAFEAINKLNQHHNVVITNDFLKSKLRELYLTHEYREKRKQERDERAEMARAQREELKLIRDMERAEEEENKYQKMLNKARKEAKIAIGAKLEVYNAQIELLEKSLAEAREKLQRAQAMAERTKSGYVYIISNIGSFGDDVVKIGLTRRLDPTDRVRELGDASVPFVFDTHAIIYSEDAPALESALHKEFDSVRINMKNYRKEFFRVKIDEVEAAVKRLAPDAPFFRDVEAQDYRETLARRKEQLIMKQKMAEYDLPDFI